MATPTADELLGSTLPAVLDALTRADIGIVVFSQQAGKFEKRYTNEPAMRALGYTVEEWLATPVLHSIAPEQRELVAQLLNRLASGDHTMPPIIEFRFARKDGVELSSEIIAGRADIAGGSAIAMIVGDHAHSPAQLSLLEADRIGVVGALAAGFAHEINNPLTSVLLNLRSLRRQIANLPEATRDPALRCVEDITMGAERIAGNVRALQALATRAATQRIDLAAVVSASLRLAAPTLHPRAHVEKQIGVVHAVLGEEARIGQAVLAMLLFCASGFDTDAATGANRIAVSVADRNGSVVVQVSDNGHALTIEEARRAFDPFFRTSSRGAGVGVGLGIARSVATALGGDVVLVPGATGGAVITMRLPAAPV